MRDDSHNSCTPAKDCTARLYVAGDAPNSRVALKNLNSLKEKVKGCTLQVTVVDVILSPETALDRGIYVTPALEILHPNAALIYGNLSDYEKILALFGENAP